ncbi:MAG: hypothetical protein Q4A15_08485, partial [Prevotellaceae bacterium]|nr:hypothetical protein [Prevotellaceae bacterium]
YGKYWESNIYQNANAYNLNFSSAFIHPNYPDKLNYGFSVRCVSRSYKKRGGVPHISTAGPASNTLIILYLFLKINNLAIFQNNF